MRRKTSGGRPEASLVGASTDLIDARVTSLELIIGMGEPSMSLSCSSLSATEAFSVYVHAHSALAAVCIAFAVTVQAERPRRMVQGSDPKSLCFRRRTSLC